MPAEPWQKFGAPKRPGPWVEKGSCGHTIAEGNLGDGSVAPAVYNKPEPCEACKRAQGGGKES